MTDVISGLRTFMKMSTSGIGSINVLGIPFDAAVTNRPGARFAPAAIRDASFMLCDGPDTSRYTDLGDLSVSTNINHAFTEIESYCNSIHQKLLTFGGDHSITLPILRSLRRKIGTKLAIVHFDAHTDTWDNQDGENHGTWVRSAVEEGLIDPLKTIQIGIRSPMPEEVDNWASTNLYKRYTPSAIHNSSLRGFFRSFIDEVGTDPVYVTFDIDCIDPSMAPGTGTPEIGGIFSWQALELLKELHGLNIAGADVVEVCPSYDVSQITALTAATIGWELIKRMEGK